MVSVCRSGPRGEGSPKVWRIILYLSGLLLGVYTTVIVLVHYLYTGHYLWHDLTWTTSWACAAAQCLCLGSGQSFVFCLCVTHVLGALGRSPCVQSPNSSKRTTCVIAVCCGTALACACSSLLPPEKQLISICIPVMMVSGTAEREDFMVVLICINLCLLGICALGKLARTQRTALISSASTSVEKRDSFVLLAVLSSASWAGLGVLALARHVGWRVPRASQPTVQVVLLLCAPCLHPFLHALTLAQARRLEVRNTRIKQRLRARLKSGELDSATCKAPGHVRMTKGSALRLVKQWLRSGVLTVSQIMDIVPSLSEHQASRE